tara:strand:+ start:247 stop:1047 length:801 start_codon:yes stop_codon:yes gene_type:complete
MSFVLDAVRQASKEGNKKIKNELKTKLYSFTPGVMIPKGKARKIVNIQEFSGLFQMDFDGIPTKQEAVDLKEQLFHDYPQIVCAYLSPSGLGVKCLMKITKCKNPEQYRRIYNAIEDQFDMEYWDKATKNCVLPLFLSEDADILYRDFEVSDTWIKERATVIHSAPPLNYVKPNHTDRQAKYFYDKTVRIFTDKMNAITDNGHPQLRDACLILGHRVSAGYIGQNEAEQMAINLINQSGYLKKGISGYTKTAIDRIKIGTDYPLEY